VITLLGDLKTKSETEGKAESKTYNKFACFCKDNSKTKSEAITDGQDTVDTTVADIGQKTSEREGKITDKGKEQQKIEETTKKLQETTEQYTADKTKYEATNADLTIAVNSAKRAYKTLNDKKSASFLDIGQKSDVQNCLDLAEALGMLPQEHKATASAFLQVDPSDPAYKFHSGEILKIIKDLQDDFRRRKTLSTLSGRRLIPRSRQRRSKWRPRSRLPRVKSRSLPGRSPSSRETSPS